MKNESLSQPKPASGLNHLTYTLFISLVSLNSLLVMAAYYLLPLPQAARQVLYIMDSINALVLLADFAARLWLSPSKFGYFFLGWGWLDLLGSLPGLPLLRIFRIARVWRGARQLLEATPQEIRETARRRLAESTLLIVLVLVQLVVTLGSIAVVLLEARSPDANILTGSDAVWWALVTIATVGYGDRYPVTNPGRVVGVFVMITGISTFSVLTSYIASTFLARRNSRDTETAAERRVIVVRQRKPRKKSRSTGDGAAPPPAEQ